MGSFMGKVMDDNMEKQQAFMKENGQAQMERQLQMQNYMREQQMAMAMARSRDLFHYWAAFYSIALLGGIAGIRKRRPAMVAPLVPLTFVVTYFGDLAYGNKMGRVRAEATRILKEEPSLLDMPAELPTLEELDRRREAAKKN